MNRKLAVMGVLSLVLSVSLVKTGDAEELKPVEAALNTGVSGESQGAAQPEIKKLEASQEPAPRKELGEVIVSATRSEKAVEGVPVTAFVIDQKKIESRNATGIEELTNRTPGVFLSRSRGLADSAPAVSLRGVPSASRSLVMLDGIPVNDGYAGSQKTMGFAVDDIERVEVVLGPSSSLYGNNAMGGVVSFYTRMPEKREVRYRVGYGGSASGERGQRNLTQTYLSAGNKFDSGLKLLATFNEISTDGFVQELVTTGTKPTGVTGYQTSSTTAGVPLYVLGDKGTTGSTNGQYAVRGEYDLGGQDKLSFSVNNGYQKNNNIGYPNTYLTTTKGAASFTPAGTTFSSFISAPSETSRLFVSAGLDKSIAGSMLKIKAGRTVTDYWYLTSFGSTASWSGGAVQKVYNPSSTNFIDAQVLTALNDSHALTWGATNQYDDAQAYRYNLSDWRSVDSFNGGKTDTFTGKTSTLGLFVQDEWAASSAASVFAGARWDGWQGSDGTAYQASPAVSAAYAARTASAISPRMGIAYKVSPDLALRASMGTAFRAPNVFDLYRPFPTSLATGTYTGNNPNLNPEKMSSIDFGGDAGLWNGATLKAAVYFNYFTDMMYNKPITTLAEAQLACPGITTANFNTASGQKCQQKTNIGAANSRGVELRLTQAVTRNISTWAMGTLMKSEITQNDSNTAAVGKSFTQVPHETAGLGLDYEDGDWSSSVSATYRGQQYSSSDDTNAQKVWGVWGSYDAYTTVDAKLSYRLSKGLKFSLAVDNLFNTDAFSYYQIQGRSWTTQISGSL